MTTLVGSQTGQKASNQTTLSSSQLLHHPSILTSNQKRSKMIMATSNHHYSRFKKTRVSNHLFRRTLTILSSIPRHPYFRAIIAAPSNLNHPYPCTIQLLNHHIGHRLTGGGTRRRIRNLKATIQTKRSCGLIINIEERGTHHPTIFPPHNYSKLGNVCVAISTANVLRDNPHRPLSSG